MVVVEPILVFELVLVVLLLFVVLLVALVLSVIFVTDASVILSADTLSIKLFYKMKNEIRSKHEKEIIILAALFN